MLRFCSHRTYTLELPEQKYVQVRPSSVAQAACDLELRGCWFFRCHGADHFKVAAAPSGSCSRFTVSLRCYFQCVVWWNWPWVVDGGSLRSCFLLLLPAPDVFVGCKARGNTTPRRLHGFSPVCRVADRGAKEGDAAARRARDELKGTVQDLERTNEALQAESRERKRADEERERAEERLRQAQAELAHVSRVTAMGELTASLAHEVNQPIAAAVTDANTCLRWLTR